MSATLKSEIQKAITLMIEKTPRNLILSDPKSNDDLKEAARLSLCRAGEKIRIVHDGDQGYSVTIPDPKFDRCEECMCFDFWQFEEVESCSEFENKFFFKCTNVYFDAMGDWECQGRLEMGDE